MAALDWSTVDLPCGTNIPGPDDSGQVAEKKVQRHQILDVVGARDRVSRP